jgi:hypothetical protein
MQRGNLGFHLVDRGPLPLAPSRTGVLRELAAENARRVQAIGQRFG